MVEYVDLPKGSNTWPFLKRWWIVVAKLSENIVCWFRIEFMLYTLMLWWIVTCSWEVYDKSSMIKVLCLSLLLLEKCTLCFYVRILFLSTPLSQSMWTCFSISVFAWGQARSKLGGVDTSILHHVYLLIFMCFIV